MYSWSYCAFDLSFPLLHINWSFLINSPSFCVGCVRGFTSLAFWYFSMLPPLLDGSCLSARLHSWGVLFWGIISCCAIRRLTAFFGLMKFGLLFFPTRDVCSEVLTFRCSPSGLWSWFLICCFCFELRSPRLSRSVDLYCRHGPPSCYWALLLVEHQWWFFPSSMLPVQQVTFTWDLPTFILR